MNRQLTQKQAKLYRFIKSRASRDADASYREMMAHMGVRSTSVIAAMLGRLEAKGWIRRHPGETRAVEVIR
jgi:SOS-response transcriptional repressor LexA